MEVSEFINKFRPIKNFLKTRVYNHELGSYVYSKETLMERSKVNSFSDSHILPIIDIDGKIFATTRDLGGKDIGWVITQNPIPNDSDIIVVLN